MAPFLDLKSLYAVCRENQNQGDHPRSPVSPERAGMNNSAIRYS